MKQPLVENLLKALQCLPEGLLASVPDISIISVERARDAKHGDFATNIALRLAKSASCTARELAQAIVAALPESALVARVEVAGAGFINFHLSGEAYAHELARVLELGEHYGESAVGRGERVLVEFVSANPTGPMHVGTGRTAAFGATLSNVLAASGYDVSREYYINDAGRQIDILAVSTWARYLELCGEALPFPESGYHGNYVRDLAEKLRTAAGAELRHGAASVLAGLPPDAPAGDKETYVDALISRARELLGARGYRKVLELALAETLADIREDLREFGVRFDRWYSEQTLVESGAVERALARLESRNLLYRKDGATWFRAMAFGDEKDRVVVRENGQKTYFASDIAYHLEKRERGFGKLLDVLGADHHGYVARVRAGLAALGEPSDCLEVTLIQFVSLYRGGEKVPMGKREAQFVTLRELREEVGNDACRLFYLMRSHDQPLEFDLELAKSRSNENPVYYIQYAHARVASVFKQLAARELEFDRALGLKNAALLTDAHEKALFVALVRYPEMLEQAAIQRAPHTIVHYLRELANAFHTYYNAQTFIVADPKLRNARLALVLGVQQVIRNGLSLLAVSAPESM